MSHQYASGPANHSEGYHILGHPCSGLSLRQMNNLALGGIIFNLFYLGNQNKTGKNVWVEVELNEAKMKCFGHEF